MSAPTPPGAAGALFGAVRDVCIVALIAVGLMVALDQIPVANPPRPEVLTPRFPGEPTDTLAADSAGQVILSDLSAEDLALPGPHVDLNDIRVDHYDMVQVRPMPGPRMPGPEPNIPRWHYLHVEDVLTVAPAGKKVRIVIHDPQRVRLVGLPACVLETAR